MRAVITRVNSADVHIAGKSEARISHGLLVLVGVAQGDERSDIEYIVEKTMNLRIFEDADDKMNLSVQDTSGEILLVSNFTLMGDCRKGRRPSFVGAGRPEDALKIYEEVVAAFRKILPGVQTGRFQADMQVSSVNDGPVTIILDSKKIL